MRSGWGSVDLVRIVRAMQPTKRGNSMPRIIHIALKVDDLEGATKLYETVFGFKYVATDQSVGHVSRHLTDGSVVLSLLKYESEAAPEAMLSGKGPCIHHFGIEIDDPESFEKTLREFGCEIISGDIEEFGKKEPIKFRSPQGIVAEILPREAFKR
jgi:lactoylglutathione lyase